jgi:hypothetical protein
VVEFLRSRDATKPSRYQLQQLLHSIDRVLKGAKDLSCVEPPIRL